MSPNRAHRRPAPQAGRDQARRDQAAHDQAGRDQATRDQAGRNHIGLVLGAGGVVGAAWMTGALRAVQDRLPCALGDVGLIVGTSAGSVLAAALRCGVTIEQMIALQRGESMRELRGAGVRDLDDGPLPPRPQLRVGSPRLMLTALLAPHRVHPGVGASAWLPLGRARHEALRATVQALQQRSGQASTDWADGRTWMVAVDYDSGQRVIFGDEGAPPASLADAVVASCSIPGWYAPVVIGGRRYVDGGVRSATSLSTLAGTGVSEVYVLAPMASIEPDRPLRQTERLERRLRRLITRALLREAAVLRARGIRVVVLTPGPEDLAAMGVNLMDPRRREPALATSLRTSAAALAASEAGQPWVA